MVTIKYTLDDVGGCGDEVVAPLFPTVMRTVDENKEVECWTTSGGETTLSVS